MFTAAAALQASASLWSSNSGGKDNYCAFSVQKIWCTVQTMLCDNIDFKWFWWETSPTPTPTPSTDDTPVKEIFPCKIFRPWTWMCVAAGAAQGAGQTVPAILVTRKWNGLWNGKALQIILKQILLQWWAEEVYEVTGWDWPSLPIIQAALLNADCATMAGNEKCWVHDTVWPVEFTNFDIILLYCNYFYGF